MTQPESVALDTPTPAITPETLAAFAETLPPEELMGMLRLLIDLYNRKRRGG